MIGRSLVLLDNDGSGEYLREESAAEPAAGPDPLTTTELQSARYRITDRLDDLGGCTGDGERLLIATDLWRPPPTCFSPDTAIGQRPADGTPCRLRPRCRHGVRESIGPRVRARRPRKHGAYIETITQALIIFGGRFFDGFTARGPG